MSRFVLPLLDLFNFISSFRTLFYLTLLLFYMFSPKNFDDFEIIEHLYKGKNCEILSILNKSSKAKYIVKSIPINGFASFDLANYCKSILELKANDKRNSTILPVDFFSHDEKNIFVGHLMNKMRLFNAEDIKNMSPTKKTELIYSMAFALKTIEKYKLPFIGLKLKNLLINEETGEIKIGFPIPTPIIDIDDEDKQLPFYQKSLEINMRFIFGVIIAQLLKNEVEMNKILDELWTLEPVKFDDENELTKLCLKSMNFMEKERPSFEEITKMLKTGELMFNGANKEEIVKNINKYEENGTISYNEMTNEAFAAILNSEKDEFSSLLLGSIYLVGKGVPKCIQTAKRCFSLSQNAAAKNNLGMIYSMTKQNDKALEYFEESCKEGFPVAMKNYFAMKFRVSDKEGDKVIHVLDEASKLGYVPAIFTYAERMRFYDPKLSFDLYLSAGKRGLPDALHFVGLFWEYGFGVEENAEKCVKYWRVSGLGMNYPPSINNCGTHADDPVKAFEYFSRGCDKSPDCAYNLAGCYMRGSGCEKDVVKACHYMKIASEGKHLRAMFNYAIMVHDGIGVEKNEEEGDRLCKLAGQEKMQREMKKKALYEKASENNISLPSYFDNE